MASHLWICTSCGQYLKSTPQRVLELGETHICDDIQTNDQIKKGIADILKTLGTLFMKKEATVKTIVSASVPTPPPPPPPPPRSSR